MINFGGQIRKHIIHPGASGGLSRPKRGSLAGVSTLSSQDGGSGGADVKLTRRQAVVELSNSSCKDAESTPDRRASRSRSIFILSLSDDILLLRSPKDHDEKFVVVFIYRLFLLYPIVK